MTELAYLDELRAIADRLNELARRPVAIVPMQVLSGRSAFSFDEPAGACNAVGAGLQTLTRNTRPPLPDPRLIRQIIRQRQQRSRFFDGKLFADPAWDILLDLSAARAEYKRVSVTSLCIAAAVPPTTALRWIALLTEAGLLERIEDDTDHRRAFLTLTDRASDSMARLFLAMGSNAETAI